MNILPYFSSNLKTLVFVNPNSTSLALLASSTFNICPNKRSPESDEGNEGEAVESSDASKSKNKKRRRDRSVFDRSKGKKNRKGKSDKDNEPEPELCSLNSDCLRPEGQEVDWIFCEGRCQGWFHQLCAGISNPQEVVHLEKYICATCQSLDEVESSTRIENGSKDSNLKKTNKAGKTNKSGVKSQVPSSTDETSMTPKRFEDSCEQRRDNKTSVVSKDTNLVSDDNAIEMEEISENNVNENLDLRDVPRVMADDEETASVLSEDRVYHETSFESIEESIVENDVSNVSQVYNTCVNNVLANVQSSSQTEAILQSDQSMVIEEIPSLTEPIVSIVRNFENGTKDYKKGSVEPKDLSDKIVICDVTEMKSNCSSQREKQVTVGNSETSVHNRQPANHITNPKES